MATKVSTIYTSSLNTSITTKEGRVCKITHWVSGVTDSTERTLYPVQGIDKAVKSLRKRGLKVVK